MDLENKIFYNEASASKLGWSPLWFGAEDFDEELIEEIKKFQTTYDLKADGLCGPMTYRRIQTEREANFAALGEKLESVQVEQQKYIICAEKKVPLKWDKVVSLWDKDNYALPKNCYKQRITREPTMIVTHFDVCLSAASCKRVLEKRGISSHFVIDNDGTIFQMVDTQYIGWHAGNHKVNKASIGIDISNAVYTKYQKYYRRKFGPRPVLTDVPIHGTKIKECLGFYPVQIEAYKALVKGLCSHYNIPIECPTDENGDLIRTVHTQSKNAKFKGIVNHYHLTRGKWDTANLEMDKVLKEIREGGD